MPPWRQHALRRLDALLWSAVELELVPGLCVRAVGKLPRQPRASLADAEGRVAEVLHAKPVWCSHLPPVPQDPRHLSYTLRRLTDDSRRDQMPPPATARGNADAQVARNHGRRRTARGRRQRAGCCGRQRGDEGQDQDRRVLRRPRGGPRRGHQSRPWRLREGVPDSHRRRQRQGRRQRPQDRARVRGDQPHRDRPRATSVREAHRGREGVRRDRAVPDRRAALLRRAAQNSRRGRHHHLRISRGRRRRGTRSSRATQTPH